MKLYMNNQKTPVDPRPLYDFVIADHNSKAVFFEISKRKLCCYDRIDLGAT